MITLNNINIPMFRASSLLKNTRLDKEIEIAEISKKLRIPAKYIEALENENVAAFPQEPYCSLIVKDYSDFLGLNGQEILALFRRDFEQKRKLKTEKRRSFSFTPQFTFSLSVVGIVVLFSVYLISEYVKFNRPPKLKISWPTEPVVLGISVDISGTTDPESTVRINDDLILVSIEGDFQKRVNLNNGETKIVVESKGPNGKITTEEKIIKNAQ